MKDLLILTVLVSLAQVHCRVISRRSDESAGLPSYSAESSVDDSKESAGREVIPIGSTEDDDSAENESGPDTKDSAEKDGHSASRDSKESGERKIKGLGSSDDDDSVEKESHSKSQDSAEKDSRSASRDSRESGERKIKVMASREDDDSAENESGPDTKVSAEKESRSAEGGPFLGKQKSNSVMKNAKHPIRELYERHREHNSKTASERRKERCDSFHPCDYLAHRVGYQAAYQQFFGKY